MRFPLPSAVLIALSPGLVLLTVVLILSGGS